MTRPNGIRTESTRTPSASRAGALHSHIHSHINPLGSSSSSIVQVVSTAAAIGKVVRADAATMDGGFAARFGGQR